MNPGLIRIGTLLLLALWLLGSGGVGAQQALPMLTDQLVDVRLQQIDAQSGAEAQALRQSYQTVRSWLERASSFERAAAEYGAALVTSPHQQVDFAARIDAMGVTALAPADMQDMPLSELEKQLAVRSVELQHIENAREALDRQLQKQTVDLATIRERTVKIDQRLSELPKVVMRSNTSSRPSAQEAEIWHVVAERLALGNELDALQAQAESLPTRYSALRTEREELALLMERLRAAIKQLQEQLELTKRTVELADKQDGAPTLAPYPLVGELAGVSAQLVARHSQVSARISEITQQRHTVAAQTAALTERFAIARQLVDFASDSEVLGKILLVHWHEIKSLRLFAQTDELTEAIGDAFISRVGHEEALPAYADAQAYVTQRLEQERFRPDALPAQTRDNLVAAARLVREQLTMVISVESKLIDTLTRLDADYRHLHEVADAYEDFVRNLILWVPSHSSLLSVDFRQLPLEVQELVDALASAQLERVPAVVPVGLLAVLTLLLLRPRLRRVQRRLDANIVKPSLDSIRYTVAALFLTLLRALPLPLLFWLGEVAMTETATLFAEAASRGCHIMMLLSVPFSVLLRVCEPGGVGQLHFGWRAEVCQSAVRESRWYLWWLLPAAGLASFVVVLEKGSLDALLGRLIFMLAIGMLGLRALWQLRRDAQLDRKGSRILFILKRRLLVGTFTVAMVLLVSVALGHVFSVGLVINHAVKSFAVVLALILVNALLLRWLRVARRRLRLADLLASRNSEEPSPHTGTKSDYAVLGALSESTSQLVRAGIATVGIVILVYIWAPLLPALNALEGVTLWSITSQIEGEQVAIPITLETLVLVMFLTVATFYAGRKVPALLELVLRSNGVMNVGARQTASTLLSYMIISTGMVAVLATLGVKWSQLQWLIAALGVGIGFGLQEIIANFISGLIILFERPIRVGDVITVGDVDGEVSRIRIRATTITDWDGKELLVPNKEFITGRLLNWTLSDTRTRIIVRVGIAYGSNVREAIALLEDIVHEHPQVIADPPPKVLFKDLGDNTLNLVARCFLLSVDNRWEVISELYTIIYERCGEEGIEIAFPQRDVHLDVNQPIRIALDADADNLKTPAPPGVG